MQEIFEASQASDGEEAASSITAAATNAARGGFEDMHLSWMLIRISSALAITAVILIVAAFVVGPLSKSRGSIRSFYGEDLRHALKKAEAYNGVRLQLKQPVDAQEVRERVLELLRQGGRHSLLRVLMLSSTQYTFSDLGDEAMVNLLIHHGESGVADQRHQDEVRPEHLPAFSHHHTTITGPRPPTPHMHEPLVCRPRTSCGPTTFRSKFTSMATIST
jgi:hypothetical protein